MKTILLLLMLAAISSANAVGPQLKLDSYTTMKFAGTMEYRVRVVDTFDKQCTARAKKCFVLDVSLSEAAALAFKRDMEAQGFTVELEHVQAVP